MKSFLRNCALFICICSLGVCAQAEAKSKHKAKEQCEKDCLAKCDKREQRYQKKLEKKEKKHKEKVEKKERKKGKDHKANDFEPFPIDEIPKVDQVIAEAPIKEVSLTETPVIIGERK